MTYVADLHIHSSYAYATSRELTLENLAHWAKLKGIDLLASADFTHPDWFEESRTKLTEVDGGLYEHDNVRFILGTELSCVGKVGGRSRRVHILVYAPSLETVERINGTLRDRGVKLAGDGRPTLGMTPRDLAELLLGVDARCLIVPAHAWTPWYGVFGSKSGFDSLEECFGDLTSHVHAVETGLSSDPAMCWRVPDLDNVSIVSFSDAHSLPKLGRELTIFNGQPSYDGLAESLRTEDIGYTIEFFPEEGKYHYSGHRKCGVCLSPDDVARNGRACPDCGRAMTLGVMQRVEELAGRRTAVSRARDGLVRSPNGRPPFRSLVSLQQILSEAIGVGVNTKRVRTAYMDLVGSFGSELEVLLHAQTIDVAEALPKYGERVAAGVEKVRCGDVHIEPGFDGQYGVVRIWPESTKRQDTYPP